MVTILLEQIIEILKGWLSSFTSWAEGVAEKLGLIEEATEYIDDIYDDTTAIKDNTSSIADSNTMIQGYTLIISNKATTIDNNVTAIKNNVGSIAASSGAAAAFAEDCATNGLNILDKVTTIASDTTQLRADNVVVKSDLDKIYDAIKWSLLNVEMTETEESDSPLVFDTDKAANLEYLNFELNATETGSGVKSPSNPYTITGVSTLSYSVNGSTTNLDLTLIVGDSVYGGYIDVVTGNITLIHQISDLGTLANWSYDSANQRFYSWNLASTIKAPASNTQTIYMLCSDYTTYALGSLANYGVAVSTTKNIYVKNTDYDNSTISDFITSLSGVKLVYELATPVVISASPATIAAIKGLNTITSNGNGKITVTYKESVKHYLDKQEA